MPTGARLLVERLKAHGVDTIFGIPGIHNLAIYDALFDERAIRVVTTRDERGAAPCPQALPPWIETPEAR